MPKWLLGVDVVSGPVPLTVWAVTAILVVVLLIRGKPRTWMPAAVLGAAVGAIAGLLTLYAIAATDVFGVPMPVAAMVWAVAAFCIVGLAIACMRRARAWRKVVAVLVIPLTLLSAAFGVNAAFGLDHTLGDMLGQSNLESIGDLGRPHPSPSASATPAGPLYQTWNPPADMPTKGKVGLLTGANAIPSTAGFVPRDASIYLPPAALVKNAPALPFMVYMMGLPGNPDPTFIAEALDQFAAKNKGLAPIVIVADQLGARTQDPVCVDSQKFGGVETYFNKDIVAYAQTHLNIIQDHAYWTMTGYSNGGACAFTWAAGFPQLWGNLINLSGDEFPGVEDQAGTLATIFHGDKAAYEAAKPAARLAQHPGAYAGHLAVFTVGQNDPGFTPGAQRGAELARGAGFDTTFYVVPGADHNESAIRGGLQKALSLLYPKLGLSQ